MSLTMHQYVDGSLYQTYTWDPTRYATFSYNNYLICCLGITNTHTFRGSCICEGQIMDTASTSISGEVTINCINEQGDVLIVNDPEEGGGAGFVEPIGIHDYLWYMKSPGNHTFTLPPINAPSGKVLKGYYASYQGVRSFAPSGHSLSSGNVSLLCTAYYEATDTPTYLGMPNESVTLEIKKQQRITIFPRYVEKAVKLIYNPNQGVIASGQYYKDVEIGSVYGVMETPTREGYIFDGWWTHPTEGERVDPTTTVPIVDDGIQVVYAHWTTGVKFSLTFNANGGEMTVALTSQFYAGNPIGTLPTATRTGYAFLGWNDANGNALTEESVVERNLWLYAKWSGNAYTLTFDAQGGTVSPATKACAVGVPVGELPTPTREGYSFAGWFTSASGGTQITAASMLTADTKLFAHWGQAAVDLWDFEIS